PMSCHRRESRSGSNSTPASGRSIASSRWNPGWSRPRSTQRARRSPTSSLSPPARWISSSSLSADPNKSGPRAPRIAVGARSGFLFSDDDQVDRGEMLVVALRIARLDPDEIGTRLGDPKSGPLANLSARLQVHIERTFQHDLALEVRDLLLAGLLLSDDE